MFLVNSLLFLCVDMRGGVEPGRDGCSLFGLKAVFGCRMQKQWEADKGEQQECREKA